MRSRLLSVWSAEAGAFREDTDIHVWSFTCRAGIRGKYSRCWERKGISVEGKEKQTTGFPHAANLPA